MYSNLKKRAATRTRRALRVKKKARGDGERLRLAVFKSNRHLYAQLIDDVKGVTLFGLGTMSQEFQGGAFAKKSKAAAKEIGMRIAQFARGEQLAKVVFDRGRFKFHGLVAAVAEGAREGGLEF
jgi:large subunit ribosomal protein L18